TLGPVYALVNDAGIRVLGAVTEISEEEWDRVIAVDLKGVFLFSRASIPLMARNGGVIINISSSAAYGRENRAAYAAAKAGVIGLSKAMALDHRQQGIRVNCVVPGFTLTGMTGDYPQEQLREMAARSVSGRIALPEDVAQAVVFLCSQAAETITGAVLEM
ncbi:MAG TPA: SDR family oxidoreductase, partial [Dehalococcoidia bacterium]|nr:SDR family oxidoreductase [Dehalococcoidia bacterium]